MKQNNVKPCDSFKSSTANTGCSGIGSPGNPGFSSAEREEIHDT